MVRTVLAWIRFSFSVAWALLGWAWVALCCVLFFADFKSLRYESDGMLVTAEWRAWFAKFYRYSTTLGRGIVYYPGVRDASDSLDERVERHERVHVWQKEDISFRFLLVGLLVGACLTQRPELYGAALPVVGVLDMLRYHLFTIGWAWAGDYGTVDDPEEFQALLAYSPLHNVRDGTRYPPTFVSTGDHDDRVVPAHSYKFAAALQAAQAGDAPILLRVDTRAGHGRGKPIAMQVEEAADRWTFVLQTFAIPTP